MEEEYTVQAGGFNGPLDLLLDLIEKEKLSINDISLATVTDSFIEHVKKIEHYPVAYTAHFIVIAAMLMLIKSKTLLPQLILSNEEEQSIEEFERRLMEYKRIKELSVHIEKLWGNARIYLASGAPRTEPVFSPHEGITEESIYRAALDALKNAPIKELLPDKEVKKIISLEEMITNLTRRIEESMRTTFSALTGHGNNAIVDRARKIEIIVGFLAMLQLVKQEIITVKQDSIFHDIHIEKATP